MLIKIGFSFTGNWALKHRNKTNSKQGKLKGSYIWRGGGGLQPDVIFGLQVDRALTGEEEAYNQGEGYY